MLLILGEL
ncbi:hypothetical protein LINPERPRIM_LOCUS44236 [Linum perenne]